MTSQTPRDFLQVHFLEARRLLDLAGDHPVMSIAWAERVQEFERLIAASPSGDEEPDSDLKAVGAPMENER